MQHRLLSYSRKIRIAHFFRRCAGTNTSAPVDQRLYSAPVIILVRTSLADNIGSTARAMLNCGMNELRLVQPECVWPSERARAIAVGAASILESARIFPDLRSAVADLHHVYATTARARSDDVVQHKPVLEIKDASVDMLEMRAQQRSVGIIFGPEATGLSTDDLTFTNALVYINMNPQFSSLNISQAVLLTGYEWMRHAREDSSQRTENQENSSQDMSLLFRQSSAAEPTMADIDVLVKRLETALQIPLPSSHKETQRDLVVKRFRSLLMRTGVKRTDIALFHSILEMLTRKTQ